jgi:hypothetical protein
MLHSLLVLSVSLHPNLVGRYKNFPFLSKNATISNIHIELPISGSLNAMDLQGTMFWVFSKEFDLLLRFFLDRNWQGLVILPQPLRSG